jgi:hypothetical protein
MSTTLPDLTYDDCIVLFSNFHVEDATKDHRSKLFLSELKHHAQGEKAKRTGASFTSQDLNIDINNMESAKSILFTKGYGLGDNDIHVEWTFWLASVIVARSVKTNQNMRSNSSNKVMLNLIRRLATAEPGTFDELIVLLIQTKLLVSITDGTKELIHTRPQWANARTFTFKDLRNDPLIADSVNVPGLRSLQNRAVTAANYFENSVVVANGNLAQADIDLQFVVPALEYEYSPGNPNLSRGVQLSQYSPWSAIDANVVISTDARYNNADAFNSNGSFMLDMTQAAVNLAPGVVPKVVSLYNSIRNKIRGDINGAKEFGYNQDTFFVKLLLKSAVQNSVLPVSNWFSQKPASSGTTNPSETYYRKRTGEIWERLSNGTEKCVDASDPIVQASIKRGNKCFGLGVKQQSGNLTCANYFKECITNGNIANCKKYLKDNNFWQNASAEVNNMLPEMAFHTLKSFEFETYDEFSKLKNRSFKMVQTWQQWLDACKKNGKLQTNDLTTISANVKLQEYLSAIVKKVNDNPAILNKDYYDEKPTDLNAAFKSTVLGKKGLVYEVVPRSTFGSQIQNLTRALNDSRNRTIVNLGSNMNSSVRLFLTGGGSPFSELKADLIEGQFKALQSRLKDNKKDISPNDEITIKKLIEQLREKELKLNEFIVMTDRYADLLQVFGQHDKETVLTIDHLKQFTDARDNYFQKVSKKQISLMSIIQSIADKVNEIDNKSPSNSRKTSAIQ